MKLNSLFPEKICNEIATTIFPQQVTEGQLIKKEHRKGTAKEHHLRCRMPFAHKAAVKRNGVPKNRVASKDRRP
jgi:hypothetical protein